MPDRVRQTDLHHQKSGSMPAPGNRNHEQAERASLPPNALGAGEVLSLQRSIGNRAVVAMIRRLTAPRDPVAAQVNFNSATANHVAQSRVLADWLAEGRTSSDVRLKNACDWIAGGKSKLYAVSPTGDSTERVTHHGKNPADTVALFPRVDDATEGGDIANPGGGDYNWRDLDDQAHVALDRKITRGWNAAVAIPSAIAVAGLPTATGLKGWFTNETTNPVTKEDVFTTLKHEVQHAADRHQDKVDVLKAQNAQSIALTSALSRLMDALRNRQAFALPDLALLPGPESQAYRRIHAARTADPPQSFQAGDLATIVAWGEAMRVELTQKQALVRLEQYKTEYRAYSYQGTYDRLDNALDYNASVPQVFRVANRQWTERQYTIFRQIYRGYPHTKSGWDSNDLVLGADRFRREVLDYRNPDEAGVNKWNSPRINQVYDLLLAVPLNTGLATADQVLTLEAAATRLTPLEATYLRNAGGAPREFTAAVGRRLQGAALGRLHAVLERRATMDV